MDVTREDRRVHDAAARGFEAAAVRYERGRPTYPDDAVAFLTRTLEIGERTDVVELGAGTGKFTELIVPTGARIVAVEPVSAMRQALERNCPTVTVLDGVAEEIPLADASRTPSSRRRRSIGSRPTAPCMRSTGCSVRTERSA